LFEAGVFAMAIGFPTVPQGKARIRVMISAALDDHLKGKSEDVKILFDALKERIFALNADGDILEKPNKIYISYKHGKNFCEVRPQSKELKIWLDISFSELDDPKKLSRDVSQVGHYGTGEVETKLGNLSELDDVMNLIEQSYRQTL
jgi:predicted transport protein